MRTGFWGVLAISVLLLAGMGLVFRAATEPPPGTTSSAPLVVYCAAGIRPPIDAAIEQYRAEYGVPVEIEYGGSGTLLSSLEIRPVGDVYVAADDSYVTIGREKGLLAEAIPVATQQMVIAVRRGNPHGIRSLADLVEQPLRIGIANPEAAAVGRTAERLLREAGLWDAVTRAVEARGVFRPTVPELANDLKLGALDAALVWDTTVAPLPEVEAVFLERAAREQEQVTIAVLTATSQPARALHLARYVTAVDRGLTHFAERGYRVVEGDQWAERPQLVLHCGGVLRPAVEETIADFQRREGVEVNTVYNGCGILVAQIEGGQRPDLYFACDRSFMDQVSSHFLTATDVSHTPMVVAVPRGNPRRIVDLDSLTAEGLRVGVCNEQQSALGALTSRMLRTAGRYDQVMANVVTQVPTADLLITQLRSGGLDAAIVYEANWRRVDEHLDMVPLGSLGYTAVQPVAVGRESRHKYLSRRLMDALENAESRQRFVSSGFAWLLVDAGPAVAAESGDSATGDASTSDSATGDAPEAP